MLGVWDRGDCECRELVWTAIEEFPGFIKANRSALRQFNNRVAELHAEATRLVAYAADITRPAADLAAHG